MKTGDADACWWMDGREHHYRLEVSSIYRRGRHSYTWDVEQGLGSCDEPGRSTWSMVPKRCRSFEAGLVLARRRAEYLERKAAEKRRTA